VTCVGSPSPRGREVIHGITDRGGQALFLQCDLTNGNQLRKPIGQIVENFGTLQSIANCAGMVHVAQLHDFSSAEWNELMDVNVKSFFLSIKYGTGHLRKNRRRYSGKYWFNRQLCQAGQHARLNHVEARCSWVEPIHCP